MFTEWLKSFIGSLERLLDKPPYLIFVFIGAVFVVISMITKYSFEQIWLFFLYSTGGTIWRYIERDFIRYIEKHHIGHNNYIYFRLAIISIYHIGNLVLFLALLHYLKLI